MSSRQNVCRFPTGSSKIFTFLCVFLKEAFICRFSLSACLCILVSCWNGCQNAHLFLFLCLVHRKVRTCFEGKQCFQVTLLLVTLSVCCSWSQRIRVVTFFNKACFILTRHACYCLKTRNLIFCRSFFRANLWYLRGCLLSSNLAEPQTIHRGWRHYHLHLCRLIGPDPRHNLETGPNHMHVEEAEFLHQLLLATC